MRPILDIEPTQDIENLRLELNERLAAVGENFALVGRSTQSGPASRTYAATPHPQSPYTYTTATINAFEYLDPLYAQLRTAQLQLRELSLFPNSVGQNQLQIDSIVARHIVASTITADKLNVGTLSAITANMGTLTAGNITLDSSGFIRGGATGYNTGTGFWMGYDTAAYKFFIGAAAGNKLLWDGSSLTITGAITASTGMIGGFDIGADYIRDTINSFGLASTVTGSDDVRFWAGATFTNRATAPFRIYESGLVRLTGAAQNLIIGDDLGSLISAPGKGVVYGNTGGNIYQYVGQSATNNLVHGWTYSATASLAFAIIQTYDRANPIYLDGSEVYINSLTSAGRVGIGTAAPAYDLDLAGTFYASGDVRVGGRLYLGNAYVAGAVVPTGTMIIYDSTGTAYRVPCLV